MIVTLPDSRVEVDGAAWLEPTPYGLLPHRLPAWTRDQYDSPLYGLNVTQPAGVRLRFATSSSRVTLRLRAVRQQTLPAPPSPQVPPHEPGPIDVVIDGAVVASAAPPGGGTLTADPASGRIDEDPGEPIAVTFDLPDGRSGDGDDDGGARRTVELWLPYRTRVYLLAVEAEDVAAAEPSDRPRWVHYGSSISHGAEAASPAGTWVGVAARAAGLDVHNLGLSGAAVMDPFVARAIGELDADVISLKIGINVLNGNTFGRRMFGPLLHGFLDTVRERHPHTPLLVISPLFCPIGEDVPGPTIIDPAALPRIRFVSLGSRDRVAQGDLTLTAMRELVAQVVAARRAGGDEALHHLDGLELYGAADDARTPMSDLLHPDPPAHELIGRRAAVVLDGLRRGTGPRD